MYKYYPLLSRFTHLRSEIRELELLIKYCITYNDYIGKVQYEEKLEKCKTILEILEKY